MGRAYLNFDLVIEPAAGKRKYRARVLDPASSAETEFGRPFTATRLENLVLRMGQKRVGARKMDSPEMESAKELGGRLYGSVFTGAVRAAYLSRLAEARRAGQGLRVRLHINVAQFHNLPWEFLYDQESEQFLALSGDTPLVRYFELSEDTPRALSVTAPLKISVLIASPEEYQKLNVEEEWQRLNLALQPLIDRGLVVLKRLYPPTLSALRQNLRTEKPHILHYIGHGAFFERQQDGKLLLEDGRGGAAPVSSEVLATVLYDYRDTLRLVVLNACEGARTGQEDPYAGVAQMLVRRGIPAVIAMQFPIFEQAAITLAREFYGAIADGLPVDAALSEARIMIYSTPNDVEWGTPVLFLRAADGVLFEMQSSAVEDLLAAAKASMARDDWPGAIQSLQQVLAQAPNHAEAKELLGDSYLMLTQVGAPLNMFDQGDWQRKAQVYLRLGNWQEAEKLAVSILSVFPDDEEARNVLEQVRAQKRIAEPRDQQEQEVQEAQDRQARLAEQYAQARASMDERHWDAAIKLLEAIQKSQPDYEDVPARLNKARREKEARERQNVVTENYAAAFPLMNQGDWDAAIERLEKVVAIDPDFHDAGAFLKRAREEKARADQEQKRQAYLDETYAAAVGALEAGQWKDAVDLLDDLEQQEPGYKDVPDLLVKARAERDAGLRLAYLIVQYDQARPKMDAKDWPGAVELLESIEKTRPGFKDVPDLLKKARAEQERQTFLQNTYNLTLARFDAKDWKNAIDGLEMIETMEPGYKDVPGLLKRARAEAERQQTLLDLLARGKEFLAQKNWQSAEEVLQRARYLDLENQEVRDLLKQAQWEASMDRLVKDALKTPRERSGSANAISKQTLAGHTKTVYSVAFSPDGKTLASGSWDLTIRLWDVASGGPTGEPITGHTKAVRSVAFSPDGKTLASGSEDNTIRLWDTATGRQIGEPLKGHKQSVTSVAFSPDGRTLASGSYDRLIRRWDMAGGQPLGEPLRGHAYTVSSVAFSPDGKTLASGSYDKTTRLWDLGRGVLLGRLLRGHTEAVNSVAFSPDGKVLASGGHDNTIRLWDAASRKPMGEPLRGHTKPVCSVAFSPDGKTLASGSWDNTVRLWDVASGQPIGEPLTGHSHYVESVAFSPDGKILASGSFDSTVRLWVVPGR